MPWLWSLPLCATGLLLVVALLPNSPTQREPAPRPRPDRPRRPPPREVGAVPPSPRAEPEPSFTERMRAILPAATPTEPAHFAVLRRMAGEGDALTLMSLADQFLLGVGREPQPLVGLAILELGAELSEPRPKTQLGKLLLSGVPDVIEPEPERAVALFVEAGEAGDGGAWLCAGDAFAEGRGVPQDVRRAIGYYEKCGNQHRALQGIGEVLLRGEQIPYDARRAAAYFEQAADGGGHGGHDGVRRILLKERAAGREFPAEVFGWLCTEVRRNLPEASCALARLIMGSEAVTQSSSPVELSLRWGSGQGAAQRVLDPSLGLTLNGSTYMEVKNHANAEASFRCKGEVAHVWTLWNTSGAVEPGEFDTSAPHDGYKAKLIFERDSDGRVVASEVVSKLVIRAFSPVTFVFVAEDTQGRLSNLVFLRVAQ